MHPIVDNGDRSFAKLRFNGEGGGIFLSTERSAIGRERPRAEKSIEIYTVGTRSAGLDYPVYGITLLKRAPSGFCATATSHGNRLRAIDISGVCG